MHGRSEVPVGTFLSGGLDSSLVTALFSEHTNNEINTFTMDFEGKSDNEGNLAKIVSKKYNTKHHLEFLNYNRAIKAIDELIPLMEEPMADSAIVPTYLLAKKAKAYNFKVILSGAGGDELFGGYSRYYHSKRNFISGIFNQFKLPLLINLTKNINLNLMHYSTLSYDSGISYGNSTSGVQLGYFFKMLECKDDFIRSMKLTQLQFNQLKNSEERYGFSYGRMFTDIKNYLLDNILALTDRTSMASSIEVRVPILDHRLVELIFGTKPSWNLHNNFSKSKYTLKKIAKSYLPSEIMEASKTGFNAPVNYWIGQDIEIFKDRIMNPKSNIIREMFNLKNLNSYGQILTPELQHLSRYL